MCYGPLYLHIGVPASLPLDSGGLLQYSDRCVWVCVGGVLVWFGNCYFPCRDLCVTVGMHALLNARHPRGKSQTLVIVLSISVFNLHIFPYRPPLRSLMVE